MILIIIIDRTCRSLVSSKNKTKCGLYKQEKQRHVPCSIQYRTIMAMLSFSLLLVPECRLYMTPFSLLCVFSSRNITTISRHVYYNNQSSLFMRKRCAYERAIDENHSIGHKQYQWESTPSPSVLLKYLSFFLGFLLQINFRVKGHSMRSLSPSKFLT